MTAARITVPQVFAHLGIMPTNEQSWAVGNRMQHAYASEFGEQPPKDNRPKTNGGGSHCFALYPATWQPRIEAAIREVVKFNDAQGKLL